MEHYEPPFTITNKMLNCISDISEKLGMIGVYRNLDTHPRLRRGNRISSVHSSLKIESNSLTEDMVRAVLNNKTVIGSEKEIQEVRNAFAAYDMIDKVDPYSVDDLKKLHGIMTYLTVEESGTFRKGEEGVFDGDRCIFMAPPAQLVGSLVEDLFEWMRNNRKIVHPLIMSCVFHYEFVFIHPFGDGNGRMARLWQSILLSEWNPVFRYIPIESQIEKFQDGYYSAISKCHVNGSSTVFIEFMLERINEVLDTVMAQSRSGNENEYVRRLLDVMEYDTEYTVSGLLKMLGLKSRDTLRRNYLEAAISAGLVEMTIPDKPTSRAQRYRKI